MHWSDRKLVRSEWYLHRNWVEAHFFDDFLMILFFFSFHVIFKKIFSNPSHQSMKIISEICPHGTSLYKFNSPLHIHPFLRKKNAIQNKNNSSQNLVASAVTNNTSAYLRLQRPIDVSARRFNAQMSQKILISNHLKTGNIAWIDEQFEWCCLWLRSICLKNFHNFPDHWIGEE